MLIHERIASSISAIQKKHDAQKTEQNEKDYTKALSLLDQTEYRLRNILAAASAMKSSGILTEALLDSEFRDALLEAAEECGRGVEDNNLTLDSVRLLKSNCDNLSNSVQVEWKSSSKAYSDSAVGYLSTIASLTENPGKARDLIERIKKVTDSVPTAKSIQVFVNNVEEARTLAQTFEINPSVESFLSKVSKGTATIVDLTPDIISWIKEKGLTTKIRIVF